MIDKQTLDTVHDALAAWNPNARIEHMETITPDASLRRYYRIFLTRQQPLPSLVAMVFDSVKAAEVSGGPALGTDEACVRLTEYFSKNGVAVPELYYDGRPLNVLLIEDLGNVPLARLWRHADGETAYQKAIDQISLIQKAPRDPQLFAFQREFGREVYLREMGEFTEFLLTGLKNVDAVKSAAPECFQTLADEICALPKVLTHRDFHAWNILWHDERARVIDFQDALLAPPTYDLVSLLHDRDTDSGLGQEKYQRLRDYGQKQLGLGKDFERMFTLVSVQRDLKVSGRFAKFIAERDLQQYGRWIPGTTARLFRMLPELKDLKSVEKFSDAIADAKVFDQVIARYAS